MAEILRRDKDEPIVEPGVLRPEHLAEGVSPIVAFVGSGNRYGREIAGIRDEGLGQNVDYESVPESYVISAINDKPKFTRDLSDCTSLIAVGRESGSGRELSFLTHQKQVEIDGSSREAFVTQLKGRLEEIKNKCSAGTIDVVIAGGRFKTGQDYKYQESIEALGLAVQGALGFEPLVVVGPKSGDKDDIYLGANRTLYVIRPEGRDIKPVLHNEPFKPSEIERMKPKWKKEEEAHKPFGEWK